MGVDDYWAVKLDSSGSVQWQNSIGGNSIEWLYSIQQTTDEGYILGGISYSDSSGDKYEDNLGDLNPLITVDYWIVKLDSAGVIQWENTIGGNNSDGLRYIQQTVEGGYILGGSSASDSTGDKTENNISSSGDIWIIKTDSLGNIQWQNTIGGSNLDILYSLQQTIEGEYILGGSSISDISGDKTENSFGYYDYWVVKLGPACVDTSTTSVWPGDANNDLIADNYDILSIALSFGEHGYARNSVSNLWSGFCSHDWLATQSNGANTKHADCNGNGLVGLEDTFAIILNYGLSHAKAEGSPAPAAGPVLTLVPRRSVYHPGDTVMLDVVLGSSATPVTELYGIAFDISFNNSLTEPGTVKLYYTDNWLGSIANNLSLSKLFESSGKADGALSRTNHQNASGYGAIGVLQFVAKQSITSLQTSTVSFSDYEAVKANGDAVVFDAQDATFTIDGTSGINSLPNELSSFRIYPNPFTSSTTIEFSLKQDSEVSLKIYDVLGRVIMAHPLSEQTKGIHQFQFENQPSGKGLLIAELNVDGIKIRRRLVQIE